MIPVLATLGLKIFQAALAAPKLRKRLTETIAAEKIDISPEVVAALSGDAAAIAKLSEEIDEAIATNQGIVERLEELIRREESAP